MIRSSTLKNITRIGIAAAFFASAAVYIHDRQLDVHRITLRHEKLPEGFEGAKILHLSDLHNKTFGEMNGNLISSCEACRPDMIFFTGDLISRNENRSFFDAKLYLFEKLCAVSKVYFVYGNHEQDNPENAEYICSRLEKLGVKILKNQSEFIYRGGDRIKLTGLLPSRSIYKSACGGYCGLKKIDAAYMKELVGECDENEFNILLSHSPFGFEGYADWGADLVFSGHCHGGIVRLPLLGGVLSPERRFFPKYTKGTYFNGSSKMVVSAGLGKLRINNPSEIIVATLTKG